MSNTPRKIGIIGSGDVGQALAKGFLAIGDAVTIGTRDSSKLADWQAKNPAAKVGTFEETAAFGDVVVLAVKGTVAAKALRQAGAANLAGKVVIDATNPITDAPPEQGVLKFFTTHDESLIEQLQREFPEARLVKAFNSVGAALMFQPRLAGGPPTMFICGDDAAARETVKEINEAFGWETADMGPAIAGRAIEPLCILWCLPGFTKNDWVHAFKVLR